MNCDWVKQNITLYIYDELPDDARHELEQHTERCVGCAAELRSAREFRGVMTEVLPAAEPAPNLLAASRMRLSEALESAEPSHRWRWTLDLAGWLHQVRFAPALAAVLLMIGFGGGVMASYKLVNKPSDITQTPKMTLPLSQASIAGIKSIIPDPGSRRVEIQYDTVQPEKVEGSIDDPRIQQLLLFAARSNYNAGVRMDSVDLLAQRPEDRQVRDALIFALRYDANPGVRLKALDGLGPYVQNDTSVRNAVLEALLNDSNPGVRSEAIMLLKSVKADAAVRQTLQQLSRDKSKFIRSESQRVLATIPEID
ncbi:MAG TPA: HEAT repeat domain-containing protein [Terriglobales bacterium]|jgi:anti-sigma factor RsiW|nr:HEAT repeat domain-containing protein [Terriglobales bacterium]